MGRGSIPRTSANYNYSIGESTLLSEEIVQEMMDNTRPRKLIFFEYEFDCGFTLRRVWRYSRHGYQDLVRVFLTIVGDRNG